MKQPRFMLAAPSSGSGKTMITCGILQILKNRGYCVSSFKCGPDYIDPMFHTKVLGTISRNLDTFFTGEEMTRYLFAKTAQQTEISVIEGVMGYYDGLGGIRTKASSYDLARVTDTPVILIVNAKGMSLSVLAQIKGFLDYQKGSKIKGVILNQTSEMTCRMLAPKIESELGLCVFGYVPKMADWHLESRHLGLVLPDEIKDLREQMRHLADILEKTLDIEGILQMAEGAKELEGDMPKSLKQFFADTHVQKIRTQKPQISVAKDEAFCFLYEDNLKLLEELGAELTFFSPLHDEKVPENVDGLFLPGGYPELFAAELSGNREMLASIRICAKKGIPILAECGGFMYLHQEMQDMEGKTYPMAGVINAAAYRTEKLGRFGYITLDLNKGQAEEGNMWQQGFPVRAHEFHYFDSTAPGSACLAKKPTGKRSWNCSYVKDGSLMGFPHLYYYSNPMFALRFLENCMTKKLEREKAS